MEIAKARRLNPLLRQVHFVSRWDTSRAARCGRRRCRSTGCAPSRSARGSRGQDKVEFTERPDGSIVSCEVRVYRKDWPRPRWASRTGARPSRPARTRRAASCSLRPWQRMPTPCWPREALALRKAFPEDMSGLYTADGWGRRRTTPETSPAVDSARTSPRWTPAADGAGPATTPRRTRASAMPMRADPRGLLRGPRGIELPGESVAVWMKHRADLATLLSAYRETAWKALCARTEEVGGR